MAESRKNFDFGGIEFANIMAYGGQSRDQLYTFLTNNFKGSAAKFGYTGSFPATAPKGLINPGAVAAGRQIAGMGVRRLPLIAGGLQALGGDPVGGAGTAAGGLAGAALGFKIGGPIGGIIGGFAGSGAGQSLTRGLTGIDINDPYSGPDISLPIFGGIPITPAAKTKKSRQRMREETEKDLKMAAPYMEAARQRQFQRDLVSGQMQMAGSLLGNIYPR
jgi:hypothetical protein